MKAGDFNIMLAAVFICMTLSCGCGARQPDFTRVVIDENIGRTAIGDIDGDIDIVTARSWDKAPVQLWRNTLKDKAKK